MSTRLAPDFDVQTRARFWMKVRVAPADACWEWLASLDRRGYGKFTVKRIITLASHRTAFLLSGREIPDGLYLDHLCRNRACCNPSHLEPVTDEENRRRGWLVRTHCRNGHLRTKANTILTRGRPETNRRCRDCKNEGRRRRRRAGGSE